MKGQEAEAQELICLVLGRIEARRVADDHLYLAVISRKKKEKKEHKVQDTF